MKKDPSQATLKNLRTVKAMCLHMVVHDYIPALEQQRQGDQQQFRFAGMHVAKSCLKNQNNSKKVTEVSVAVNENVQLKDFTTPMKQSRKQNCKSNYIHCTIV